MKSRVLFILIFLATFDAVAQAGNADFGCRIKAGFSIGGMSPLPLPAEIRKVEAFNPLLNLMLGGEAVKSLSESWLLLGGLQLETKGMETKARVKSYNLTMVSGNEGEVSGVFTGVVRTRVKNSYLTVPLSAMWRRRATWGVKAGLYGSLLLDGDFGGSAYDGYLREGNPIGERVDITTASYEFSSDLQRWSWGVLLGAEWRLFPHLLAGVDLTWGVSSIFKKSFEVISYKMYPIYGTVSFGYVFF